MGMPGKCGVLLRPAALGTATQVVRSRPVGKNLGMKIAVLGLGRMGQALAGRLLDAGHELVGWDRTPGKAPGLEARGVQAAPSIGEAVDGVDLAITSLANDDAVRAVACGAGGVRSVMGDGTVYVDASTISPVLSAELDQTFLRYAAMPVLGSPEAVHSGDAIYLVGGRERAVEVVSSLFPALSDKVFRYPEPPLAHTAKLAVNLLLLNGVAALAESFAVGRAGGLSADQLRDLLGQSPVVAPGIKNRFEGVLTGEQEPWWGADLGAKDAGLAIDVAAGAGTDLALTAAVRQQYERAAAEWKDQDIAVVTRLYLQGH